MTINDRQRDSASVENGQGPSRDWRDQVRDSCLTILLVLEICAMFVAGPLAARGLPIAQVIADTLVIAVLVIVVLMSRRWTAIVLISLGLTATAASFVSREELSPNWSAVFRRGGEILAFSA